MLMKLPSLYAKLANLIDREANTRKVARRHEVIEKTTATYRISKADLRQALQELEDMQAIRRKSRQLIESRV
jgi:DNA-binding GntR family transcriptional regulator